MEELQVGRVVVRRYRNRQIGNILKELKLTEAKCTGIPTILKAIHNSFIKQEVRYPLSDIGLQIIFDCAAQALSKSEIAKKLNQTANSGTLKRILPALIEMGVLEYTIPDKLKSSLQKYRTTALGYAFLDG